jgi:hypothetical protein
LRQTRSLLIMLVELMGLRTWNVHLHKPGRRETDAGDFLATYRDVGDRVDDEPEIGSVIYLGLTAYQVLHALPDSTPTGGKLVVEPLR